MANNIQWTEDQQNAIQARGGSLVVSAAAGSGKTAVLVERCIQRLTDTEHECSADRLLIVTFTRAATAEMRSRLAEAIADRLVEDPQNEHLQKQQMLLPSAQICTIDSFCGNLVRENFEQLGLAPDFRLLDESEVTLLKQTAMDQTIEKLYAQNNPSFLALVELLASGRDDASIEENILRLHTYSRAYPSPDAWLQKSLHLYEDPSSAVEIIRKNLVFLLDSWVMRWETVIRLLSEEHRPDGQSHDSLVSHIETEYIARLQEWRYLAEEEPLSALLEALETLNILGLPSAKKLGLTKEQGEALPAYQYAKNCKAEFTNSNLQKAFDKILVSSEEDALEDARELKPLVATLVSATGAFDEEYTKLKTQENALDFSDVELYALRLLVEDPAEEPARPTELAKTLQRQYHEILIDEYQDTNKLQDLIFSSISNNNLFLVGDVKQSIYRFRQAMPELFLERKERYPRYDRDKDLYPATVILGQNYRSRKGVLGAVNDTFTQLMSKEVGDLTYDETEQLNFGASFKYEDRDEPDVEFHIVVPEQGADSKEAEAAHIAAYISKEINNSRNTDHPLTYKDFAILLRSTKNVASVYRKVLQDAGIPVYAEQGDGFLETPEVLSLLSLLEVIDNPLQDVPLLSAMTSPMYGFTEDEIASIRVHHRKDKLYPAVLHAAEHGDAHCEDFLRSLRHFRTLSVSMGAGELVRQVLEETSFLSVAGAMPNGVQRKANLHQFMEVADSYDANSSYGLSGFVRHLNRLAEGSNALATAATLSPNANVVQIMSIHKSKGLEFKVCILADTKHQFNDRNQSQRLILHPALGIGLQGRQPDTGFTYPTLIHSAIQLETKRSERSEALRILYVAMTRAKEKLVMTACDAPAKNSQKDPLGSSVAKAVGSLYGGVRVPAMEVLSAHSFYKWLLLAFLRHPGAALLRARDESGTADLLPFYPEANATTVNFVLSDGSTEASAQEEAQETLPSPDAELVAELQERMAYRYPYEEEAATIAKRSASHLTEKPFSTDYFAETRPESLSGQGMTPAERGTCLHKFMQYANFTLAAENPAAEKQNLVANGFLLEEEANVVDEKRVREFFASDMAKRIQKSPRLYREHKFAILQEDVLIQGIVDCAFEEDGALVLLDYKTDRVKNAEDLASRYRDQLDIYKLALEETLGLPVKETALYSFHLGEVVKL